MAQVKSNSFVNEYAQSLVIVLLLPEALVVVDCCHLSFPVISELLCH